MSKKQLNKTLDKLEVLFRASTCVSDGSNSSTVIDGQLVTALKEFKDNYTDSSYDILDESREQLLEYANLIRQCNIGEVFTKYQMSLMSHELLRMSKIFSKDKEEEIIRAGNPIFYIDYGNLQPAQAQKYVMEQVNYCKTGEKSKKQEPEKTIENECIDAIKNTDVSNMIQDLCLDRKKAKNQTQMMIDSFIIYFLARNPKLSKMCPEEIVSIREKFEDLRYFIKKELLAEEQSKTLFSSAISIDKDESYNFGDAIKLLKDGYQVYRTGWNGADMYLQYVPEVTKEMTLTKLEYIQLKTVDSDLVPWVVSQTDVFAEDYRIYRHESEI